MNQGNVEKWKGDNGIWQDGGILIHFEKEEEWIGIFLAFQSQSWCTDDEDMLAFPLSIVIIRVILRRGGRSQRTPSSYFIKPKTNKCRNTREQQCHARKRNEVHIILHHFSN